MPCSAKEGLFSEVVRRPEIRGGSASFRNRTVTEALLVCNLPLLEYPKALGQRAGGRTARTFEMRHASRTKACEEGVSVYYLPWWGLLACLAASALAGYLVLRRTQAGDSPWALFPLTVALAPVMLVGAMVVAITLSTLLSTLLKDPTERTGSKATPEATAAAQTLERTVLTTSPSPTTASPSGSASPTTAASPSASTSLPACASPTPSAPAGARTPR
jgi:hypothetical protein